MMAVVLSQSCRTDHFSENEKYTAESNSSLLRNKRISLKDSKHRETLSVELLKANANIIKKSKNLRNGQKSFLEESFSINTDDVIFIENGPNYHTYTFYINTEQSSGDEPLNNLVLSLLPDGTYKQLLIQYYFTEEQKKKVLRGEPVKASNTVITDLGSVEFSNKTSDLQSCGWEDQAVYVGCSHTEPNGESTHNASNVLSWGDCKADVPPSMYTVAVYICTSIAGETNTGGSTPPPMPTPPHTGGGGGGNDPCTSCPPGQNPTPQPCTQIPNQPVEPTTGTGEGECSVVIPTLPNLPNMNNDPCEKTKAMLQKPEVESKINDLYQQSMATGEKAFMIKNSDGLPTALIDGGEHHVVLQNIPGHRSFFHNHTKKGINITSCHDIYTLFSFVKNLPAGESSDSASGGVVDTDTNCPGCPGGIEYFNFIIRFTGTRAEAAAIRDRNYTEAELEVFEDKYKEFELSLRNKAEYAAPNGNFLSFKGLEQLFFYALDKMNIDKSKMILQRVDKNGQVYNVTLDSNGKPIETPCV